MKLALSHYVALELSGLKARHGLTNKELGAKVGLSESTISKTLTGTQIVDVDRVALIAEALNTRAAFIFIAALDRYEKQKKTPHPNG